MAIDLGVLILVAVITFGASFIQSTTGFGFGIVSMIFLPFLLSYTEANVLSAVLSTLFVYCVMAFSGVVNIVTSLI